MLAEVARWVLLAAMAAYVVDVRRDRRAESRRRHAPRVAVLHVHLAETRQYQRLVRFVEDVDDQSAGDPALQELVTGLRGDLVRMAAEGDDDAR
jgi:hypothetical protein